MYTVQFYPVDPQDIGCTMYITPRTSTKEREQRTRFPWLALPSCQRTTTANCITVGCSLQKQRKLSSLLLKHLIVQDCTV